MSKLLNTCKCLIAVVIVAVLAGCPAPRQGKVVGWVTDPDGTPLPFVSVTAGGKSVHTDGSGLFTFNGIRAGASVAVGFSLNGYGEAAQTVEVKANTTNTVNAVLKKLNAGSTLANPAAGGSANAGGNSITFGSGALHTGGQKTLSAAIRVTPVSLTSEFDAGASLGGLKCNYNRDLWASMTVYSLVNFQVIVNGEPVDLNSGSTATVQFKVVAGTDLEAGDTLPLWYFDPDTGRWVQRGTGTVVSISGALYVQATIDRLGWWCCATVGPAPAYVTGHVYDTEDQPVEGALIVARGLNYHGRTVAVSDETGAYSIDVLPNSQVRLQLVLPGAYYVADTLDVTSGAAGSTLADKDLAPEFLSTVFGHVTEEDGTTPVPNTVVYSSTGGTATTATDGSFCMAAPGSTPVAVYVQGRPPVFAMTPATATCGAGDGAEVTISVYYPRNGDRLGFIFSTLRTTDIPIFGPHRDLTSTALFYSGFKGEQFAPYDPDAPLDTCKTYVSNPDVDMSLAVYFGLLTNTLAFNLMFNVDLGVSETFNLDDGEAPSINKIGALDAGSPGSLTNGTTTIAMKRPSDYFIGLEGSGSLGDLGYALLEPWMGGFFFQEGFVSDDFNNGETLSFSWPGGLDIGPFTAQGVVPGRLTLTAPADLGTAFEANALANGLAVTWDTAGQGDYVSLVLETVVIDNLFGPVHVGAIVCRAADDGAYTIPASALAQMPTLTTQVGRQVNYLIAKRHTSEKITAPLTRDAGSGYVVLNIGTEPVMRWSLDARFGTK